MIGPGLLLISTNTLLGKSIQLYRKTIFDLFAFVVDNEFNNNGSTIKIYVYSIVKAENIYPLCLKDNLTYDQIKDDPLVNKVIYMSHPDNNFIKELNINYISEVRNSTLIYILDIIHYLNNPIFNWSEIVGDKINVRQTFPNIEQLLVKDSNEYEAQTIIDYFTYVINIIKHNSIVINLIFSKFSEILIKDNTDTLNLLNFAVKIKNQSDNNLIAIDLKEFNQIVKNITKTDPELDEMFDQNKQLYSSVLYHDQITNRSNKTEIGLDSDILVSDPINILFVLNDQFYSYLSFEDLISLENYCTLKKYNQEIFDSLKKNISTELAKRYELNQKDSGGKVQS